MRVVRLFRLAGRRSRRRYGTIRTEIDAGEKLLDVAVPVAIAEVYRVSRVERIVAFDGVLILAIVSDDVDGQIVEGNRVGPGAAGYRPCQREKVAEVAEAVDLKILDAKRVRDAELFGGEPGDADVADVVWTFDVLTDRIRAKIERIRRRIRWCRGKAGDSRVPIDARKSLAKN